jgi:hypothetical protein
MGSEFTTFDRDPTEPLRGRNPSVGAVARTPLHHAKIPSFFRSRADSELSIKGATPPNQVSSEQGRRLDTMLYLEANHVESRFRKAYDSNSI